MLCLLFNRLGILARTIKVGFNVIAKKDTHVVIESSLDLGNASPGCLPAKKPVEKNANSYYVHQRR